jgi:Do/DeqQ family serine protease
MRTETIVTRACGLLLAAMASGAAAQLPVLGAAPGEKPTLAPLIREVAPAVVSIYVEEKAQAASPLQNDPLLERFFGLQGLPQIQPEPREGAGSGVIIDAANGYVITNHHVLAEAEKVMVVLNDGRRFEGEMVGSDEGTDIGLVRIDADNLTDLELGDSDSLEVGDFVLAIGNPFGLGQTVTSGIVSALGRGIDAEGYEDFIQTDASINPGNSGGALIDLDGQLVGINSVIIAPAGGNVGIGFAVPSNMASAVVRQLVEYGEVQRGKLGVSIEDLTPDLTEGLGLDFDQGAYVREVMAGSPAESAGLQPGDIIVEFDGQAIDDSTDLRNTVGLTRVGSTVPLTYVREGQRHAVNVTIARDAGVALAGSSTTIEKLRGAQFRDLSQGDPAYGKEQGVVVVSVADGSPAARTGLLAGDLITAVGGRTRYIVRSVEELANLVGQMPGTFALFVLRDGRPLAIVVR